MANLFYDYLGDPRNNDIPAQTPHIQSAGYSGIYQDIIAPSAANYPPVTPTRYFIQLPVVPDQVQAYEIKDITTSTVLTRVFGAPGTNQYFLAPQTSKTPDVIELNSGQAGHAIGFDYYGIGSILHSSDVKYTFQNTLISGGGAITISGMNILPSNNIIEIESILYGTGSPGYTISINGDTTDAHYWNEGSYQQSNSWFKQSANNRFIGYSNAFGGVTLDMVRMILTFSSNAISIQSFKNTYQRYDYYTFYYTQTISSITSFAVISDGTISAGSRLSLKTH